MQTSVVASVERKMVYVLEPVDLVTATEERASSRSILVSRMVYRMPWIRSSSLARRRCWSS